MTTEGKIKRLIVAERHGRKLRQLKEALDGVERASALAEHEADQTSKAEESAVANLGLRRKAFAEAREALARMERAPGVSFLGLKSPSRLKLEEMRRSLVSYARASDLAFARETLARKAGARARSRLAELGVRAAELQRDAAARTGGASLAHALIVSGREVDLARRGVTEAEIDGAVMANRVDLQDAARARAALRQSNPVDFER